jgi:carboxyl-terminal processing protease
MALILFCAGLVAGRLSPSVGTLTAYSSPADQPDGFGIVWEVWNAIQEKFYSPATADGRQMTYGAIRGMLAALVDRHTIFVEPPQHELETDTYDGGFGGIGVTISIEDQSTIIVHVHEGSPADRAGLRTGDIILSVDGTRLAGLGLDKIVLLVRGPAGTPVELTVKRSGEPTQSFSIKRERIDVPSLGWKTLSADIGYVQIDFFSSRTGAELARAIKDLEARGVRALVLDLRSNGGGVVDSATKVLSKLVGRGIAYREVTKDGQELRHPIPFDADVVNWPLAVLIDEGTASSAEIVAAAIRDHGRGLLIGSTSYGKGSVQGVFPLSDGSSVHVTIARWLSSDGHPIEGVGLEPDLHVPATDPGQTDDLVLQRGIEHLRQELQASSAVRAVDPVELAV